MQGRRAMWYYKAYSSCSPFPTTAVPVSQFPEHIHAFLTRPQCPLEAYSYATLQVPKLWCQSTWAATGGIKHAAGACMQAAHERPQGRNLWYASMYS